MKKGNKQIDINIVFILVIVSSIFMFFWGCLSTYRHFGGVNFTLLGDDKELKKFISTYDSLVKNYYGEIDRSILISGAINGMYSSLDDPYTTYLDNENTNNINNSLNSRYTGIGIRLVDEDNKTKIAEVVYNSPAFKAGLAKGDIIIALDSIDTRDIDSYGISELISASDGEIELKVLRNGKIETFNLKIDSISVPNVKSEILTHKQKKIGYIKIEIFNDMADIQFEDAIIGLEKAQIEALIIDLRNNTGGYLEVSKNIIELFLEKGSTIYSLENKNQTIKFVDITKECRDYPIAILVNSKTASASEILASSLKYSYGAKIIGTKTYGKGKVQQKNDLLDGTSIKYTTAKWLMPNGECLDGIGLIPDIEVELNTDKLIDDYYKDNQILYALDNLVD